MFIDRTRQKLINAIVYFAQNTKYLGKIKLFKLLYLLDFEHYRQTGRSVTGLEYRAWKFGPVPTDLMQEWEELEDDLADAITIEPVQIIDYVRENVNSHTDFNSEHFSKREIRIMEDLARMYGEEQSPRMIDVTHAENGAWAKVWNEGLGNNEEIPYYLAVADDDPNRDAIIHTANEYGSIRRAFQKSN